MAEHRDKFILAIDHGTSGVKTSLMTTRGEMVGHEREPTPIHYLPGGGAEQDPDDWWNALLETGGRLIGRGLVPAEDVAAVCVSSTFSSTVAVDSSGRHLMNCLTWMDSRGAPYIKEVVGGFPSFDGYCLYKMLPWIYKSGGGPQLSGKDDVAHVLFIKRERPEIYSRTHMFMGSKDYLNLRLSGEFAASYDSMSLFWVTNSRDPGRPYYDDYLLRLSGLDKNKLPPMRRSIDVLGYLKPEVAGRLGLKKDVKVIVGSPDHQAACVGSGAVRDFEGHLYVGTSSWIQCVVPFKKTDVLHSIASLPTSIPGKYYCANEQDAAGGCLTFLIGNILYHRNEVRSEDPPADVFERVEKIAARTPAGSGGLIFTPWLNGERTPVDDPNARAGFHNLGLTSNLDHMVRAVLEGVAYNNRWALGYVEKFIGRKMDGLNMIGGGALSPSWRQIFADVTNREIRQIKDPVQANARGAAFIASAALGYITFEEIPGLVKVENVSRPEPGNVKIYNDLYGEFLQIYRRNAPIYRRLNLKK